ncbi:MAG TPA: TolC family protein, partial [Novosphingobium sp.]|nr:TolC family protein [Novosphingobium sp.]
MHTPRLPHCLITAALLPALLAGCVSAPKLGPKPAPRPLAAYAATQTLAATPGASAPAADWWRAYADPQLTALIEEGLASAPDVAIAVARLRQAEGYHQQAGAALLPRLDAKVLGQEAYIHDFPGGIAPNGWAGAGAEALQLSFDIDLWGKNRAALRAARHEDEAAALDLAQARLTLSTAIASSYADLARLYAERDVQAQAVQVKENTRRMVADRVANGLDTQAELKQAEAAVPTAQADLLATDEQIALARNTLAALLGKGPDRGLAIARPA